MYSMAYKKSISKGYHAYIGIYSHGEIAKCRYLILTVLADLTWLLSQANASISSASTA